MLRKLSKILSLLLLLLLPIVALGQTDTLAVEIDSVETDTIEVAAPANEIQHSKAMRAFFTKLSELEKTGKGKVNIVHIGDSHIQADLMTDKTRKDLQAIFGNGGRGFAFPHRLAGTNGSSDYKFTSNADWDGWRNINSVQPGHPVGLSGNALTTRARDFVVEFDAKFDANAFTTIKIVTPDNRDLFRVATAKKTITFESDVPKKITHRIKNGEVLGSIADKYNVSVSALKKANGLKSDRIRAGKTLKIPTTQREKRQIAKSEFIPLEMQADAVSHFYVSDKSLEKIYLLPSENAENVALSGLVLENDKPGLLYHSIGVNGAKFSDYNKYPAFFSELKALKPDLIILSLGTNESFDKMKGEDFMAQLEAFTASVKKENPEAEILVLTPPPSQFRRRFPNTFAADYATKINEAASDTGFASWDLYSQLGGLYGVGFNARKGIIGGDRVHYSHAGYAKMGALLTAALLKSYEDFKSGSE